MFKEWNSEISKEIFRKKDEGLCVFFSFDRSKPYLPVLMEIDWQIRQRHPIVQKMSFQHFETNLCGRTQGIPCIVMTADKNILEILSDLTRAATSIDELMFLQGKTGTNWLVVSNTNHTSVECNSSFRYLAARDIPEKLRTLPSLRWYSYIEGNAARIAQQTNSDSAKAELAIHNIDQTLQYG